LLNHLFSRIVLVAVAALCFIQDFSRKLRLQQFYYLVASICCHPSFLPHAWTDAGNIISIFISNCII